MVNLEHDTDGQTQLELRYVNPLSLMAYLTVRLSLNYQSSLPLLAKTT